MSETIELAKQLIFIKSITPEDNGCQKIIAERLRNAGFNVEHLRFGDVDNLWATHGDAKPLFVFAGHTDVVPPGPDSQWTTPPFQPDIRKKYLYGRGAADMKGALAAMITATENFIKEHPKYKGSIGFLITSDEEGIAINGTKKVVEQLNRKIDYCVIGEASSREKLGDEIKNGRRGSLTGRLTVHGKQGHIAYPQIADNPIHKFAAALAELTEISWDEGNEFFPPTSLQFSNINAGTGADNVIPGELTAEFNFSYSTEVTAGELKEKISTIVDNIQCDIDWRHSGTPFITPNGALIEATKKAIKTQLDVNAKLSTAGGTSDGRFIAPTGAEVIELGPINKTIHQIDECVAIESLNKLTKVYQCILENLFTF